MALVINLKKDQQVIINGAVIENISGRTVSLRLKNEAAVLRENDILTAEQAVTPASRVYYTLQCVYLFPQRRAQHLRHFKELIASYGQAAPSAQPIVDGILAAVADQQYYAALKQAQRLIDHEGKVLSHVQEQLSQTLQRSAGSGKPAGDGSLGPDPGSPEDEGGQGSGGS
jgi:flagellar protein FlbT